MRVSAVGLRHAPHALVLALLPALAAAGACHEEASPTDMFIAATEEAQAAHCACEGGSSGCRELPLASECERRVLREREGSIASWLECAARTIHEEAQCVERLNDSKTVCSEVSVESCRREPEDFCGRAPELPTQRIQDQIERECAEPIECSDGSRSSGRLCNGVEECFDGSDEFCDEDFGSGATGSAGVAGIAGSGASKGVSPPSPDPGFFCQNGEFEPLSFLCDGFADCSDGSDEVPFVMCPGSSMGMTPPPPEPADAGVAMGTGGASSNDPATQMCLQASAGVASVSSACLHCACAAAPMEASICDESCWGLIACVNVRCGTLDADDVTTCAVQACSELLAGAMVATLVAPVLRASCPDVCPVPESVQAQ